MEYRSAIAIVLLLFVIGGGVVVGNVSADRPSAEVTGISMGPLTDNPEYGSGFGEYEDMVESAGYSPPDEVTVVGTDDHSRYVVFSSEPIPAGEVSVSGTEVPLPGEEGTAIIADEFSVDQTGESVSFTEFDSDPSAYAYQVIELNASMNVGSVAFKPAGSAASQTTLAGFDAPGTVSEFPVDESPGQLARWSAVNLSDNEMGSESEFGDALEAGQRNGPSFNQQFWGGGDADATVAILPQLVWTGGEPEVYGYDVILIDVDYHATELGGVDELKENGEDYAGKTVTVESDIVGTSTSPRNF